MTQKQFSIMRIVVAIIIAMTVSYSMSVNNYYLPIIILLITMPFLYLLKKQVKDILADERDYKIAGDAARYAITIYSVLACFSFFILYALREINPYYEAVASTLSYSVCFLLLLNGLIFRFYHNFKTLKKKSVFIILSFIFILILVIAGLKLFSGEDNWICDNGKWIRHGNPNFPEPVTKCEK